MNKYIKCRECGDDVHYVFNSYGPDLPVHVKTGLIANSRCGEDWGEDGGNSNCYRCGDETYQRTPDEWLHAYDFSPANYSVRDANCKTPMVKASLNKHTEYLHPMGKLCKSCRGKIFIHEDIQGSKIIMRDQCENETSHQ